MTEIALLSARNCRFYDITASAITVHEGVIERCLFKNCIFDASSLVLVFRNCEFYRCYFRGSSGFVFQDCKCSNVELFDLAGCTIQGGSLYRCVYDSDLPLNGTTTEGSGSITSHRGIKDSYRSDYEPYTECSFPSYKSVGEILDSYNLAERPRVGAVKQGIRELREARERAPQYPPSLKDFLRRRLRRPQTFGLSDDARHLLFWLVSVDRYIKGLVWPTIYWLAGRTGKSPNSVLAALEELKDRGWVERWAHTRDLDVTWLDYEYAQRHMELPMD
jgi:hypothetical protein